MIIQKEDKPSDKIEVSQELHETKRSFNVNKTNFSQEIPFEGSNYAKVTNPNTNPRRVFFIHKDQSKKDLINISQIIFSTIFALSFLSKSNLLYKFSKIKCILFIIISLFIILSLMLILKPIINKVEYENLYQPLAYLISSILLYYIFPFFLYSINLSVLYSHVKKFSEKTNKIQAILNRPNDSKGSQTVQQLQKEVILQNSENNMAQTQISDQLKNATTEVTHQTSVLTPINPSAEVQKEEVVIKSQEKIETAPIQAIAKIKQSPKEFFVK